MTATPGRALNADVDWSLFSPVSYSDHNYQKKRDDDHDIVERVRDFFGGAGIRPGAHGIDVGPGANLYPSLAMLPYVERLDLWEFSEPNVSWLRRQVTGYDANWDDFWAVFAEHPAYAALTDPRARLAEVACVTRNSIFELPRAAWDIGTMFFVACSLSTDIAEFRRAVECFARALKPDAPFAAAFMVNSRGYDVGDVWFPAVAIAGNEVTECLASLAYDVRVDDIDTDTPLRDGCGMVLATGRAIG